MDYNDILKNHRHKKVFSIQDLIDMKLISEKELQAVADYQAAKKFVEENFNI